MRSVVAVLLTVVALAAHAAAGRVVTGGVGYEEREALERDAAYNVKLVTVAQTGQYLADVDVQILDATGASVVATRTDGPWLMAELPAGRYRLVATYGGVVQTRDLSVTGTRQSIVLRWNVLDPGVGPGARAQGLR